MPEQSDVPWITKNLAKPKPETESKIQKWLCEELRRHAIWYLNVHGHAMQRRGIPDVFALANGRLYAIELKRGRENNPTALQQRELESLASSGAEAMIARGRKGAKMALRAVLGDATAGEEPWLERVSPPSSVR